MRLQMEYYVTNIYKTHSKSSKCVDDSALSQRPLLAYTFVMACPFASLRFWYSGSNMLTAISILCGSSDKATGSIPEIQPVMRTSSATPAMTGPVMTGARSFMPKIGNTIGAIGKKQERVVTVWNTAY